MTQSVKESSDEEVTEEPRIILDGCVLLNLYASRRITEILGAQPRALALAEYVLQREALWVGRHKSGPEGEYEPVDVSRLVASGLAEILKLEGDVETAHFLTLAAATGIDDGEATCGAIARARGLVVATDDKAALKVFARLSPPIASCSTASIVKHWVDREAIDPETLRRVLVDIRERACFEPSPSDPLQGWWRAAVAESSELMVRQR